MNATHLGVGLNIDKKSLWNFVWTQKFGSDNPSYNLYYRSTTGTARPKPETTISTEKPRGKAEIVKMAKQLSHSGFGLDSELLVEIEMFNDRFAIFKRPDGMSDEEFTSVLLKSHFKFKHPYSIYNSQPFFSAPYSAGSLNDNYLLNFPIPNKRAAP
jgi:hypothetical protein